ncbi:kinectin isoform X3 [Sardina pilchardus]|uniref:kinectin isoform X3 n=1 Tax=Sardina pilchardus TaxID=27697 RepID=UPI002E12021D
MAVELYDSQYLLILAPSLVVALIFLFFWLFMKETSYDEVLARHKTQFKYPSVRPEVRKKNDRKKSKKKEGGGGGGGGGGGESEEEIRDADTPEASASAVSEEEEDVVATATPVVTTAAPVQAEPASGLRKRRERKQKAAPNAAAPASEEPDVNSSKPLPISKTDPPPPVAKQLTPPPQQNRPPTKSETGSKKKAKKLKTETAEEPTGEIKTHLPPPAAKELAAVLAEVKSQEAVPSPVNNSTPPPVAATAGGGSSGKRKSSKKQKTESAVAVDNAPLQAAVPPADAAVPDNHQGSYNENAPSPTSGPVRTSAKQSKKQKNETDRENSEMKLKELLSGLSGLVMSDAEVLSVVSMLHERSPGALESWYKTATKNDPSVQQQQERERLLNTFQEEACIAKDKVKQLAQELQLEKQKTGRAEAMIREQRVAMEKELNVIQAKSQSSYQELNNYQIKHSQMREQLETQIARLTQENGILRDAVSSATNQMESKQSAELNKLRSECSGLVKELTENSTKLQQEELQRKNLEVNYKQNVSQLEVQLQDAKRRWEELQNYLHNVNTEREKLQATKQELQTQLMALETDLNNKSKEIQNLHSSLTDTIVSKEQVEQRVMQLLEVSQHSLPDESMQQQVQDLLNENKSLQLQIESLKSTINTQATTMSHFEELQKLLAEKEQQRKSLEDSLNAERTSGACRETNMQAIHNDNMSLKGELQQLQLQMSEQASSQVAVEQLQMSLQEKDNKIKTVETVLEAGLIEMANKEEVLKVVREENETLKEKLESLQQQTTIQASSESALEELHKQVQEKDMKIKSVEECLQKAMDNGASKDEAMEVLEKQLETLRTEVDQLKGRELQEKVPDLQPQILDLQTQLAAKDLELQALQKDLEEKAKQVEEVQQQGQAEASQELLTALSEKNQQMSDLQAEVVELRETVELHKKKNNELRQKNWSAMEALSATEAMLQGKLSRSTQEHQVAVESSEAECRATLHRLLPQVPVPSEQNHQQWLQNFERAMAEVEAAEPKNTADASDALAAGDAQHAMLEKLREADEAQKVLQKDCETYKKVLAETEGILQRLQNSVEQEESRWRMNLEMTQTELKELRRENEHLGEELEQAGRESSTYQSEIQELKTQFAEAIRKLATEESERQEVTGDISKAQQSLEHIQEIIKEAGQDNLLENSSLTTPTEDTDSKEKMLAGMKQTVKELQLHLQSVKKQLTKAQVGVAGDKDSTGV